MEFDELKATWTALHADVAKLTALQLDLARQHGLDRFKASLRPLLRGQALQMGLGALLALWGGTFWVAHRAVPHLLATGLVLHAYGLALLLFGIRMHVLLGGLGPELPVLELQRLAGIRHFYARVGLHALGLPWWVLWLPLLAMALMSLFGADLVRNLGPWYGLNLAFGFLGWGLTVLIARWAPTRFEALAAGASLRRAEAILAELDRFEGDENGSGNAAGEDPIGYL